MVQETKKTTRKFSDEFKKEAVELALNVGTTQAAKDLGIHESLVRKWKKLFSPSKQSSNQKTYIELEKENKRLNKELMYMKEINKILKKSTAIFSQDIVKDLK